MDQTHVENICSDMGLLGTQHLCLCKVVENCTDLYMKFYFCFFICDNEILYQRSVKSNSRQQNIELIFSELKTTSVNYFST